MSKSVSLRMKDRVSLYLKKNNLKPSDIVSSVPVWYDNTLCLNVTFKNNTNHYFKFIPISLTKNGKIFFKTTALALGAASVIGIYGSFKFKDKGEKVELNNIPETEASLVINNEEAPTPYINQPNVEFEYVDPNTLDPYKMIDSNQSYDVNSNKEYREINIEGSSKPNISSYNYVLDNYYDEIDKYGNRYGIDPAVIAATIMVECGAKRYDDASQHNYSALGLGQVNCKLFENYTFKNVYNFDTGSFEDYTFKTSKIEGNRDEQIKLIAIMHQMSSRNYHGNLNCITVSYNQGGGTVKKIADQIVSTSDYVSRSDVYSSKDTSIIDRNNNFTYGDPDYFSKIMVYLSTLLKQKAFGSDVASVWISDSEEVVYTVNTQYKIDVPTR